MTNQPISSLQLLKEYQASDLNYELPVVLGKNAEGKAVFADLVELEHILMAGATGSGKSTFELSIIATFTKLFSPTQLKFFLVDMKRVELTLLTNSAHLLAPVAVSYNGVFKHLEWIKKEKNNRLKSNKLGLETLPYIIVVIDTFSDLILHNSAEFQKQITETTKNAAKVKIHFIMSDSRCCPVNYTPSIKASFPTKICFNTASVVDSKTLIGVGDAVNLKGKGDMLLLYPKKKQTIRLQAPFISRQEIYTIANQAISLSKLLKEYEVSNLNYELPIVLGKNTEGKTIFADLFELKHILMAGQTGSGKSVFLQQLIWTLVPKFPPDKLELLLIDMKVVEFSRYKKLPHLITNPITNSGLAVEWLTKILDKKKRSKTKKRNTVIFIDTFSDIMYSDYGEEFTKLVNEIILKGSSLGIYLLMCDSRVSKEVFDKSFTSGFKTKICFKVMDEEASIRIINSSAGIDLLGKGDMLLLMENHKDLIRLQAPWISSEEIKEIMEKIHNYEHLS